MFNLTPKWIKNFPREMDREALTQLAKTSKGPFEKSRKMYFVVCAFTDEKTANAAIGAIEKHGWQCRLYQQSDDPSKLVVEAGKEAYMITEDNYVTDTNFFTNTAEEYGASYDGWFASN